MVGARQREPLPGSVHCYGVPDGLAHVERQIEAQPDRPGRSLRLDRNCPALVRLTAVGAELVVGALPGGRGVGDDPTDAAAEHGVKATPELLDYLPGSGGADGCPAGRVRFEP